MLTCLCSKLTNQDVYVATTHLKARQGALLSTLRNEQGKDILEFISEQIRKDRSNSTKSDSGAAPVICTGDFNAEPIEPVYKTMTSNKLGLNSAYCGVRGMEPEFTTWKVREDGEHIQTLDYIFHSEGRLKVESVLGFPSGSDIGSGRVPSDAYASDHFSLVADFKLIPAEAENRRS